ncbi:MAG: SDR family oxidoreductase [Hyphomicrobiales bacterium]|nr:SDR family oxidoreductase [Hyphomicrobiales bacterium]
MTRRLAGKVALISGARRGIGLAIAKAFVGEGAIVWLTDLEGESASQRAAELGENARSAKLDVREEADWIAVFQEIIARDAKVDVLVNNAGITGFEGDIAVAHDPECASLEAWRAVHATNLDGVFLGCKHAIRHMRGSGRGSIINISSRSGMVGIPTAAAYASSKAAVRNHTKSVALWCAQHGLNIQCNSVHPAAILTPMWEPMLGTGPEREARMNALVSDTPLQRFGAPEEVAAVCVVLASGEAAYVTGAEINIDGGLLAGSVATLS